MTFYEILAAACRRLNLVCNFESGQSYACLVSASGREFLIPNSRIPLNLASSARVSGSKGLTKKVLTAAGLSVPTGTVFDMRKGWQGIFDEFIRLGRIAIVKPDGGECGRNVYRCNTEGELAFALADLHLTQGQIVLEEMIVGREFRVLVLDSEILYMIERLPFCVIGDGEASLMELLVRAMPSASAAETLFKDRRTSVQAGSLPLHTVLAREREYFPLPIRNGPGSPALLRDCKDFPSVAEAAISATNALHLRYAGVDVIVSDSDGSPVIIEVNSAPELEGVDEKGGPAPEMAIKACERLLKASVASACSECP